MAKKTTPPPTTPPATTGTTDTRMAGDVWKTWDASKYGGAGFDDADLAEMQKLQWTNNDIFKAAVVSGKVDAATDAKLRALSTTPAKYGSLPKSVKRRVGEDLYEGNWVFTGGDPKDEANYVQTRESVLRRNDYVPDQARWGPNAPSHAVVNSMHARMDKARDIRMAGSREITQEGIRKGPEMATGGAGTVYQWGGINADGTPQSLTGWERVETGEKGIYERQKRTWITPEDMIKKPPTDPGGGTDTPKPSTDPSDRFDPGNYRATSLNTPSYTYNPSNSSGNHPRFDVSSGASSDSSDSNSKDSTEDWLGGYSRYIKNLPSGYR